MKWNLAYIMPNLTLNQGFETKFLALVSFKDERLRNIMSYDEDAKRLINGFVNSSKRKIEPVALILREDAPESLWSDDAIVSFRNILAVSILVFAWANVSENSGSSMMPLYSDYFDLYPVTVGRNGGLITRTIAGLNFSSSGSPFVGVRDISIPSLLPVDLVPDELIYNALINAWEKRYIKKQKNDKYTRILFRSLEMAFHALSLPAKNHSTLYDFGLSISLWVSALEILGHYTSIKSNQESVINYLGKFTWFDRTLNYRRYSFKYRNKVSRINIIQKLTKNIYDSRNAFLHGNKVGSSYLHCFHLERKPYLIKYAPIIYRTALWIYLNDQIKRDENDFTSYFIDYSYESSLKQLQ